MPPSPSPSASASSSVGSFHETQSTSYGIQWGSIQGNGKLKEQEQQEEVDFFMTRPLTTDDGNRIKLADVSSLAQLVFDGQTGRKKQCLSLLCLGSN